MMKSAIELVTPIEFHRWEKLPCSTRIRERYYCTKCGGVWETPASVGYAKGIFQPSAFPHQKNEESVLCDADGCDEPPTPYKPPVSFEPINETSDSSKEVTYKKLKKSDYYLTMDGEKRINLSQTASDLFSDLKDQQ